MSGSSVPSGQGFPGRTWRATASLALPVVTLLAYVIYILVLPRLWFLFGYNFPLVGTSLLNWLPSIGCIPAIVSIILAIQVLNPPMASSDESRRLARWGLGLAIAVIIISQFFAYALVFACGDTCLG